MVGLARRRRPKFQARSAVSRTDADLFELDVLFYRAALARRKSRTPTARHPYQFFSMGAAAPCARSARPRCSQMVGLARRRRPKFQARSAVSRADADLFELDELFYRAALARGESRTTRRSSLQQIFRWALPRRDELEGIPPCRPKPQARSAVSGADGDFFELDVLFDRAALARRKSRTPTARHPYL